MYSLNATVDYPAVRPLEMSNRRKSMHAQAIHNNQNGGQNSPQPSNHSEITTASSNSDSGIGFHNDFANVSDRIVVVDFANANGVNQQRLMPGLSINNNQRKLNDRPVPFGAESIRNIRSTIDNRISHDSVKPQIFHSKSRSLDYTLNDGKHVNDSGAKFMSMGPVHMIRAMPDTKQKLDTKIPMQNNCVSLPTSPVKYEKYETIFAAGSEKTISDQPTIQICEIQSDEDDDNNSNDITESKFSAILTTRSCDDIILSVRDYETTKHYQPQFLASFDDVSLLGEAPPPPLPSRLKNTTKPSTDNDDYVFLAPQAIPSTKRMKKKLKKTPNSNEKSNAALLDEFLSASIVYYKNRLTKSINGKENTPESETKLNSSDMKNRQCSSKAKRRLSIDFKEHFDRNVCSIKNRDFNVWGSLQDLEMLNRLEINQQCKAFKRNVLEPAYSEPELLVSIHTL